MSRVVSRVVAVAAIVVATSVSCEGECPSPQRMTIDAAPGEFSFLVEGSGGDSGPLQPFYSAGAICGVEGDTIIVRRTRRPLTNALLARADSELVAEVVSADDVTRVPLVGQENLVVCRPSTADFELCGVVAPGPERKASAKLVAGQLLELQLHSGGEIIGGQFLSHATFMDACIAASRRTCAPSTITPEECAAASVDIDDCARGRGDEIGDAFECEAACGEDCVDPCGLVEQLTRT